MAERTPKSEVALHEDPNYVLLARFQYSRAAVEDRYPDGAPDHIIADALGLESEEEVGERYDLIVARLRTRMVDSAS